MGEEPDENEDIDAVGGSLKMAYMTEVPNEELPRETEGSTEFIDNRLKLRKYFKEFKFHSTKEWRDLQPLTDWSDVKPETAEQKEESKTINNQDADYNEKRLKDPNYRSNFLKSKKLNDLILKQESASEMLKDLDS